MSNSNKEDPGFLRLSAQVAKELDIMRKRRGMSKTELGQASNKLVGFISTTLSGKKGMSLRTAYELAEALGAKLKIELIEKEAL